MCTALRKNEMNKPEQFGLAVISRRKTEAVRDVVPAGVAVYLQVMLLGVKFS